MPKPSSPGLSRYLERQFFSERAKFPCVGNDGSSRPRITRFFVKHKRRALKGLCSVATSFTTNAFPVVAYVW